MRQLLLFFAAVIAFSCNNERPSQLSELDRQDITVLIRNYEDAFKRSDWSSAAAMIHPDVFKYTSRQEYEKTLSQSMQGESYKARITAMNIDSIYPVIERAQAKYSLVRMKVTTSLTFPDDLNNDPAWLEQTCEGLRRDFGYDLLRCEPKSPGLEFIVFQSSYVAYTPEHKKWYCITMDDEAAGLATKIIPQDVRKKFGF